MTQTSDNKAPQGRVLLLASEQQVHAFDFVKAVRVAIGRHESNDLQLRSRTVSNYHAEILGEGNDLLLRDLDSTNGTYVNDERVQERRLKSEDRIRIGNHVLTVHLKPVDGTIADIFVSNPDGSNERNLTNSPVAFRLCPRWRE